MPFPDTPFSLRDLQRHGETRQLLWFADFTAGGTSNRMPFGFGVDSDARALATDENGWASLVNGTLGCFTDIGSIFITAASRNPRGVWRVTFAAAAADITRQCIGFGDILNSGNLDKAMLRQLTTGNVFFVTQAGGSATTQTTDLGALTGPYEWRIETIDAGASWQCYKDDVLVANHGTTVPASAPEAGANHARSGGLSALKIDWTIGEHDRAALT